MSVIIHLKFQANGPANDRFFGTPIRDACFRTFLR